MWAGERTAGVRRAQRRRAPPLLSGPQQAAAVRESSVLVSGGDGTQIALSGSHAHLRVAAFTDQDLQLSVAAGARGLISCST